MNREELISKAEWFAKSKHYSQKRKYSNKPYHTHPEKVANILHHMGTGAAVVAAGWLHDVLEDTDTTHEEIKKIFGEKVANLVAELTYTGEKKDKKHQQAKKMAKMSKDALTVKLADRYHNIKSAIDEAPESFIKGYINATKYAISYVRKHRSSLTSIQEKLISLIEAEIARGEPK